MSERDRIVLFTGPSLHRDRAAALIEATILPPIRRGDLAQVAQQKPEIIGIIDGEFYQSLAVSPKEILPLLESGIAVYGASSMGALRAVELRNCGMIGVGRVFRLFRCGVLDADDDVALAYSPSTYKAVSEPLVNTRYVLRAAVRRKLLTRVQASQAIEELKSVYFPERTNELLLKIVGNLAGKQALSRLRHFLASGAPNVKKEDAELLIARIQARAGINRDSKSCEPCPAPLEFSAGAA